MEVSDRNSPRVGRVILWQPKKERETVHGEEKEMEGFGAEAVYGLLYVSLGTD